MDAAGHKTTKGKKCGRRKRVCEGCREGWIGVSLPGKCSTTTTPTTTTTSSTTTTTTSSTFNTSLGLQCGVNGQGY